MKYGNLILTEKDHGLLKVIMGNWSLTTELNKVNFYSLSYELRKAKIVADNDLPKDIARLNSVVDIETPYGILEKYELVQPSERNPLRRKLSISSPLGSAIIGYAEGDEVSWNFPIGVRIIKILSVNNEVIEKTFS